MDKILHNDGCMYVTAPLLTFAHVNHKFKLSTDLFSMESMTFTTDEHLYKMLQTTLQLSKSRLICATAARWHYLACDLTWSQKICVNPNSTPAGGVKKPPLNNAKN